MGFALSGRTYPIEWRTLAGEFGHAAEILRDASKGKFVSGTSQTAQPQTVEFQDRLEMSEQHLDLLPFAA